MNQGSRCRRQWIALALMLPLLIVFAAGLLNAQPPRPPKAPPPKPPAFNNPGLPKFETVWTCSNCRKELGRGPQQPQLASCPNCGVKFINGGGIFNNESAQNNGGAQDNGAAAKNNGGAPNNAGLPNNAADANKAGADSGSANTPGQETSSGGRFGWILVAVIGVLIVLAVLAAAAGFIVWHMMKPQRKPRKKKIRSSAQQEVPVVNAADLAPQKTGIQRKG
jgi:DNA-directed RNA polymerase subunit RPC12/RpoP